MSFNFVQSIPNRIAPNNNYYGNFQKSELNGQIHHQPGVQQLNNSSRVLYPYVESKQLPSIMIGNQMQPPVVPPLGYPTSGINMVPGGHSQSYYYPQKEAVYPESRPINGKAYYPPIFPATPKFVEPISHGGYTPNIPFIATPQSPFQYKHSPQSYQNISPKSTQEYVHRDDKSHIDYSSIVSHTLSPSIKRKRRSSQRNSYSTQSYSCKECGKIFQKPYNLKSHMKTHSDEKPFMCSFCPKTFARSHDKKRHEVLHGGEKNFKCEGFLKDGVTKWGCGKKFARSDALSRHFRTETGWLCIKPLMDEAKKSETDHTFDGLSPGDEVYLQPNAKNSYFENSSLIKKLIQGK